MAFRQCVTSASVVGLALLIGLRMAVAAEVPTIEPPSEQTAADQAAPTGDTVQAIWKHQEIAFYYQSFTTFYSCYGLEGKLSRILKGLGVHGKVKVRSADCPSSVARMPRVVLNVTSPVEATPEALADRDKNKSVRELAERVKGKPNEADPLNSLAPFPAKWQRVSLTRGRWDLEPGDCDLIEEVKRKVLPHLAVRVKDDDLQCSPNQLTLGQPRLEVEALVELPKADDAPVKQPGT